MTEHGPKRLPHADQDFNGVVRGERLFRVALPNPQRFLNAVPGAERVGVAQVEVNSMRRKVFFNNLTS